MPINARNKYVQVMGFIVVFAVLWRFGGVETAAVTAAVVAIWEFLKPSGF